MISKIGVEHSVETIKIFMQMGIIGMIIGWLFDIFKAFHISFKKVGPKFDIISVQITDTIFLISSFCLFILGMYVFNDGEMRSYCILGTITGVILYFFVLSHIVGRIMRMMFMVIYSIFGFFIKIIKKIFAKIAKKQRK